MRPMIFKELLIKMVYWKSYEKNITLPIHFLETKTIYISNKSGKNLNIGEVVKISTYENNKVTASLIKHIFFRTFLERNTGKTPNGFYPFRLNSSKKQDDLVREFLPDNLQGKISFKKQIEIQLRFIEHKGKPTFGFVINMPRIWSFELSCKEIKNQIDLIGIEVLHRQELPFMNTKVMTPITPFIGIIKSINIDNEIAVVSTNEGDKTYPLNELYLRRTSYNIKSYLTAIIGEVKTEKVFDSIFNKKEKILDLENLYSEIETMAKWISQDKNGNKLSYQNLDGFCFTINKNSNLNNQNIRLFEPTFIYNQARTQTDKYPDRGLTNFGPYDSSIFPFKTFKVLAICSKEIRGHFTHFLSSLFDGMPNSKYFKKGLKSKYELQKIDCKVEDIFDFGIDNYDRIIRELDDKPDIVIIEIPSSFRKCAINKNPYYILKAKFFSMGIPLQFVSTENIRKFNEYKVNAIALQIYAKVGGIPFLLPFDSTVDRELVIGIGHSMIRNNSYKGNKQNRIVGITTFFSGDGQYLLSNKAKEVGYEEYFEELLSNLKRTLDQLIDEQSWEKGDTVRLVFHIFKPIKNVEFDVVKTLVKEYHDYNINFAFVTISKKHPFILFDKYQKGKFNKFSNKTIGKFVPKRGSNIRLDSNRCLIQMLGVDEMKTNKHGSSSPLLISIRIPEGNYDMSELRSLMFRDLDYLVQQIYRFTYLSWRGFLKNEDPVTMKYSNLIADILGKLRLIDSWDSSCINLQLKRKKWFL